MTLSPLDVLRRAMQEEVEHAELYGRGTQGYEKHIRQAAEYAQMLAPYEHSKMPIKPTADDAEDKLVAVKWLFERSDADSGTEDS